MSLHILHICASLQIYGQLNIAASLGLQCIELKLRSSNLKSAVLTCERFKKRRTFVRVAEHLDKIQKQFALSENKIVATVTDNASNFIKAFKDFGIEIQFET